MRQEFDFETIRANHRMMRKMAPIQRILKWIPGLGAHIPEEALSLLDRRASARIEGIIDSMTPLERRSPEILDLSRRQRIARGSGATSEQVGDLVLKLYEMRRNFDSKRKR